MSQRPGVFTAVQPTVTDPAHARQGQAGYIVAIPADKPDQVGVKWDSDGSITAEPVAGLRILSQ